jgi:hypothetical protein
VRQKEQGVVWMELREPLVGFDAVAAAALENLRHDDACRERYAA